MSRISDVLDIYADRFPNPEHDWRFRAGRMAEEILGLRGQLIAPDTTDELPLDSLMLHLRRALTEDLALGYVTAATYNLSKELVNHSAFMSGGRNVFPKRPLTQNYDLKLSSLNNESERD